MTKKDKIRNSLIAMLYARIFDGPEYWVDYPEEEVLKLLQHVKESLSKDQIIEVLKIILR